GGGCSAKRLATPSASLTARTAAWGRDTSLGSPPTRRSATSSRATAMTTSTRSTAALRSVTATADASNSREEANYDHQQSTRPDERHARRHARDPGGPRELLEFPGAAASAPRELGRQRQHAQRRARPVGPRHPRRGDRAEEGAG